MDGSQGIEFNGLNLKEKYHWIEEALKKFKYPWLKKAGKGVIRKYIEKVTGYSRAQVNRLVWRYLQSGKIKGRSLPAVKISWWSQFEPDSVTGFSLISS